MNANGMSLPGNAENMAQFFNTRASGYEQHMQETVEDFDAYYVGISQAVEELGPAPRLLDLGVGTGLELERVFAMCPEARVDAIDVSSGMLEQLRLKNRPWLPKVRLIEASFFEWDFGTSSYDGIITSMALHHWLPPTKLELYKKIHEALRPDGLFVNADYVATTEAAAESALNSLAASHLAGQHERHIDVPLPASQEQELLSQAGFLDIQLPFERANACIMVARRG